jgi:hypothetical protein
LPRWATGEEKRALAPGKRENEPTASDNRAHQLQAANESDSAHRLSSHAAGGAQAGV